jgi:hypothetical protein
MVFTNLGRIVAFLALLSGILWVAGGLMIATGALAPEQAALATFFGKRSTGAVIDRGFYMILFSIALGILTEISRSVRKT